MELLDTLTNIYEIYCNSEEYSEEMNDIVVEFEWLRKNIQTKEYLRLESEVLELISQNDKIMFESGFYFAWKIFHQCNSIMK